MCFVSYMKSQVDNGKTKARVSPLGGDNSNNRRESRNDSNCPTVIMGCGIPPLPRPAPAPHPPLLPPRLPTHLPRPYRPGPPHRARVRTSNSTGTSARASASTSASASASTKH